MGGVFGRVQHFFKFGATREEELQDLKKATEALNTSVNRLKYLERQYTRTFAIYGLILYILLNFVYFAVFLPKEYLARIYALVGSALIAVALYGLLLAARWFFRTSIRSKEERVLLYKERKQELLEEVKNKENYQVAKRILEEYGETVFSPPPRISTPDKEVQGVRQRVTVKPAAPGVEKVTSPQPTTTNAGNLQNVAQGPQTQRLAAGMTPTRLPRALLPPNRTIWGTILDSIVGDGPSHRYALVCKNCQSHNGMALEEEFEYLAYRCAYCNYFNGARKQKPTFQGQPVAENEPGTMQQQPQLTSESGDQSKPAQVERMDMSGSESDSEEVSKPHRSIQLNPSTGMNESGENRSRSLSMDKGRQQQTSQQPALSSSSDESISRPQPTSSELKRPSH